MTPNNVSVLMFGWELPPNNTGGLGVACYGLAKGLSQAGTKINFALPRILKTNIPFMNLLSHRLQNVKLTAINSPLQAYMHQANYETIHQEKRQASFKKYGHSIYQEALRFGQMAKDWSASKHHNIIHAHDWMTYPAGMNAKLQSGKPFVTHVHATEYDRTGGYVDSRIADIEYQGMSSSDHVITVSHYTKDIVTNYYSIPTDKVTVVHNGVDPVQFTPADIRQIFPHDKVVLFVGRLTIQKGVDYFIQAARRVLAVHPDTIFLIVGDGDMYQQLIMDAAYQGISSRFIFTGFLKGDKLKAIYQMADVFVMPSVSEPYGIVALEAIASGTPCIISKQSGVAETVNHVHKVDFWDTHKMASLINHVISFPQTSFEMNRLAQLELSQLTWEKSAHKTLSVYQSLL